MIVRKTTVYTYYRNKIGIQHDLHIVTVINNFSLE
jgi:hypothetical protein